jgi:hypothetical protein
MSDEIEALHNRIIRLENIVETRDIEIRSLAFGLDNATLLNEQLRSGLTEALDLLADYMDKWSTTIDVDRLAALRKLASR